MKQPNFTLTKDTAPIFIHRLNRMMNRTGCIQTKIAYTGKQKLYGALSTSGITNCLLLPVTSTGGATYLQDKTVIKPLEHHPYLFDKSAAAVLIANGVSGFSIPFGTKMYVGSDQIQFKVMVNKSGGVQTIRPYSNIELANSSYDSEHKFMEEFYDDYLNEMLQPEPNDEDEDEDEDDLYSYMPPEEYFEEEF